MLRLVLAAVLVPACATDVDPLDTTHAAQAASTDPAIAVLDGAQWFRTVSCPSPDPSTCQREASFWVDLQIRNDAYAKVAGIVWIDEVREPDGPWHVAYARYEGGLAEGLEQWGVDVTARVISGIEPRPRIRFAAFVEMAGTTSWDNHDGADHVLP